MQVILQYAVKYLGGQLVERLVSFLLQNLTDWAVSRKIREIQVNNQEHDTERYYLLKAIANASDDEERRTLSITLARLHAGKLPDTDS